MFSITSVQQTVLLIFTILMFTDLIAYTESTKFELSFLQKVISDNETVSPAIMSINFGNRLLDEKSETQSLTRYKVDLLSKIFKKTVQRLRQKTKRIDLVFLIDSSSSVGKSNFMSEIKFVKKMLGDFNVSYNYTRVAIVTFSSQGKIVSAIEFNVEML